MVRSEFIPIYSIINSFLHLCQKPRGIDVKPMGGFSDYASSLKLYSDDVYNLNCSGLLPTLDCIQVYYSNIFTGSCELPESCRNLHQKVLKSFFFHDSITLCYGSSLPQPFRFCNISVQVWNVSYAKLLTRLRTNTTIDFDIHIVDNYVRNVDKHAALFLPFESLRLLN